MPFHPLYDDKKQLVRAWCDAVRAGLVVLPRQVMGGLDLDKFFELQTNLGTSHVHTYTARDGQLLGAMLVYRLYKGARAAEVGWVQAMEATELDVSRMLRDGLEHAFAAPELHRLTWDLVDTDGRGRACFLKYGFVEEGRFRESAQDGQSYQDVVRLALLRKDWLEAKEAFDLPVGSHGKDAGSAETYSIQVLTDANSWIASYVEELADEWRAGGNTVRVSHKIEQSRPADFCFCLSFSRIVTSDIRKQYRHTLVVHESDLPKGRGWAPMTWQILEGKSRIPVTLFEAVDAVDAGPIYLQEWITLTGTELHPEWRAMQGRATQNLCRQWVQAFPDILEKAHAQEGEASVYSRRTPADSRLDPGKTLAEQFNLLRVVDNENYPAFFEMYGMRYRISIETWLG